MRGQDSDSAPPTDPRACGWEPPVPATQAPGVPLRRGAAQAWGAGGDRSRAAHARRGESGVCGHAGNASSERLEPAGAEYLVGRRGGPKRGTHQNNRREQRLASCSGLGFTSVCTGSILPGVRAAGRARGGRVRGSGRRSRVRMLELRAGAPVRSAGASQAAASGNRPALTPPPGTPRGARYAPPPPPPPPGARELRVACEHSGRGRRVGNGGDHAQGTRAADRGKREAELHVLGTRGKLCRSLLRSEPQAPP